MKAKKSLGQHFLKSEKALNSIVRAGELCEKDRVIEIGPGTGALTSKLLETSVKVLAIEKDDKLFELLRQKYEKEISSGQLTLIHDDILDFKPEKYNLKDYKLIANIPYSLTGIIIRKFLETNTQPEKIVLLVQKEVAERIMGSPQHSLSTTMKIKESVLSISVKVYGTPRYIETVKAGSFAPMPKVDSAIIVIENISKEFFTNLSEEDFFDMVRVGFRSKRKKLSSNLAVIFKKETVKNAFQKLNLDENLRAENAGIEIWSRLFSLLTTNR